MASFLKKRFHLIILVIILITGMYLRTYDLVARARFDHDSDLFSWIVKDVVVNKHLRLIGQLTTAPGIFIGPFFYYSLIPFYLLFNMDPIAASVPITILALFTLISYYLVFSKLFNIKVGLIATFLYTFLIPNIDFDRRVVPSTPTNIWVIWYFFVIYTISKGNYKFFFLLGILIGLIWHIHIALLPALIAIPAAILISGKLPSNKQILYFIISLVITSIPLVAFEARHNFSQTTSLINNFSSDHNGSVGLPKFFEVINMISKNITTLLFTPLHIQEKYRPIITLIIFTTTLLITLYKKLITTKITLIFLIWIIGVAAFFTVSSVQISEYYFFNIEIILITLISLTLYLIYKSTPTAQILIISLFVFIAVKNIYFYTTAYIYHKGYVEKRNLVNYIKEDMQKNNFPCIGISYITHPGENVGFRYFLYLNNIKLAHPSLDLPVYNIFVPEELSQDTRKQKYGHVAVVPPDNIPPKDVIEKRCKSVNTNLTDPMFGYVE